MVRVLGVLTRLAIVRAKEEVDCVRFAVVESVA